MKISTFELKTTTSVLMRTEVLYSVASARATGDELTEILYPNDGRGERNTVKVMKELKKQGRIKVYVLAKDINGQSKEAEYLLNKYPELKDYREKPNSVIVML